MWRVENSTPFAVGRSWGRDKDGIHEWIVAVRATFDLDPDGGVRPAAKQPAPLLLPKYNGEDGESSIRYDSDLVGSKPTTDVTLNGTAYAPHGEPTAEFTVSLRVSEVTKRLRVVGNRRWEMGLLGPRRSPPEPIAEVPIEFERSFGGSDLSNPDPKKQQIDLRNPVGCGLIPRDGAPLPNFEYPGASPERAGPAGFGAIPSYWSPRLELNGTYDQAWQKGRYPLLPEDWDARSLQSSLPDQRPATHLRGGEMVELKNLTPYGSMSFELPRMSFRFQTHINGRRESHQGYLSSVIIEPDYMRLVMVWQSVLPVRNDGDYLETTFVSQKPQLR